MALIYDFPVKPRDSKSIIAEMMAPHFQDYSEEFRHRAVEELSLLLAEKWPSKGVEVKLHGHFTPDQIRLNEIELTKIVTDLRADYLKLLTEIVRLNVLIIAHECSSKGCRL